MPSRVRLIHRNGSHRRQISCWDVLWLDATRYHRRPAYRYTVEDSVYIAEGLGGRGIGKALLTELVTRCEAGPWQQMLAIVGDSGNAGSIALHRSLGFEPVGTLRSVGFKFGGWVDTVLMQRPLNS